MDESTVRQERRSEAMALMNLAGIGPAMGMDMKPGHGEGAGDATASRTRTQYLPAAAAPGQPGQNGGTPQGAAGMQEEHAPRGRPRSAPRGRRTPRSQPRWGAAQAQAGLSMSPDQFAQQQVQAAQQMGMGAQG